MEYDFRHDAMSDRYYARFSFEHEMLSRFFTDELGANPLRVQQLLHWLQQQHVHDQQERSWLGQEMSVYLFAGAVTVQSNALLTSPELDEQWQQQGLQLDDDDNQAHCGLEDFITALSKWLAFIQR